MAKKKERNPFNSLFLLYNIFIVAFIIASVVAFGEIYATANHE